MPAADNLVVYLQLIRPLVPHTVRLLQVRQFVVQDLLTICCVVLSRMLHCCCWLSRYFMHICHDPYAACILKADPGVTVSV